MAVHCKDGAFKALWVGLRRDLVRNRDVRRIEDRTMSTSEYEDLTMNRLEYTETSFKTCYARGFDGKKCRRTYKIGDIAGIRVFEPNDSEWWGMLSMPSNRLRKSVSSWFCGPIISG